LKPLSDISRYLTVLAKHGDILTDLYQSGRIEGNDAIMPALHELHNERVAIPCGAGQYRLNSPVKTFLDNYTQRPRSFEIGDDIGAEIKRMQDLLTEYLRAVNEGRSDDIDRLEDEVLGSIYNVQDSVSGDLTRFRQITENSYSTVRDQSEKARQNEHYLKRARVLQDVLNSLNGEAMHDEGAFGNPLAVELAHVFHGEVSNRIGEWSALLLSSIDIMKEFLFRYREITQETRRLRALNRFLKTKSPSDIESALELASDHLILRRPVDPVGLPMPDFVTNAGRDALADVVSTFKPIEQREVKERQAGTRIADDGPMEVEPVISLEEKALSVFLSDVDASDGVVSARDWLDPAQGIVPASFLEQVLIWSMSDRDCDREATYLEAINQNAISGNMLIEDIQVCRAA
jgi:hypothetical protein